MGLSGRRLGQGSGEYGRAGFRSEGDVCTVPRPVSRGSDVQGAREALQQARARGTQALDRDTVLKAIEALVAALESLTKFGRPIQWAPVSLAPLVMAAYLLKS
jgi:hypothetical protein